MNGIIYTRVSTKEQADKRTSLETQESECQECARREGSGVPEEYIFREEGESAKFADRTELQNLLTFVRENKNKVDVLYIWKIDRLARNLGDYYGIKVALSKYDVKIVSVTEPIDDDPVGRFLEAILAAAAQFDNEIRTIRTITGMRASVEKGKWPHQAPVGYLKEDGRVVIDPIKGPIIGEVLTMFSTGTYSRRDMAEYAFDKGISSKSGNRKTDDQMKAMLTNWIYAGLTHNRLSDKKPAKGRHDALVKEEVIEKNINILFGNQISYVKRGDDLFPLRKGTILCSVCTNPLTGGTPKGNGGRYTSYYCNKKTCTKKLTGRKSVSASTDRVHADFRDLLDNMKPLSEIEPLFKRVVVQSWNKAYKTALDGSKTLSSELYRYKELRQKAMEDWAEGKISDPDKEMKCDHLDSKIEEIEDDMARNEKYLLDKQKVIDNAMEFIADPKLFWNRANLQVKKAVQTLLFPTGIVYDFETGFGTAPKLKTSLLMEEISQKIDKNVSLVAVTGIEPVTSGL